MVAYEVSSLVNRPANDELEVVRPLEDLRQSMC